jgi:MFS family permease
MANYFYLSGAIANVVFIRWSDYIGRKRVLLGIMIVLCIGTVLCHTLNDARKASQLVLNSDPASQSAGGRIRKAA